MNVSLKTGVSAIQPSSHRISGKADRQRRSKKQLDTMVSVCSLTDALNAAVENDEVSP